MKTPNCSTAKYSKYAKMEPALNTFFLSCVSCISRLKFVPPLFLFAATLLFFTGCSTFNRDWKTAAAKPHPNSIEGAWEGNWLSDANQHSGGLRCIMEKISDERYRARFDSTYKKVLHFKSAVVFNGTMTNDVFHFDGEAKLAKWAGGIYHYKGHVSPTNFFSTYRNKYDHGTFQMTRP